MCYKVRPASTFTLDKVYYIWHRHGKKRKNLKQINSIEQHDNFILEEKKLSPVNTILQTGILVEINIICYSFISLEE